MPFAYSPNPALAGVNYERGEGRVKHVWKHDRAGFKPARKGPVGKCHSSITDPLAQQLLRTGVVLPSPYGDDETTPQAIYNVYRGVPYVAVPTNPGTYHGYPMRGRFSASLESALARQAEVEGTLKNFKRWMKKYKD